MAEQRPWDLRLVKPQYDKQAGSHYTCNGINGDAMDILRTYEPDDINWVFLATSGVHGSYQDLDDAEADLLLWETDRAKWREEHYVESDDEMPDTWSFHITCVIVMPRMVTTCYGNAVVRNREDIAVLRQKVEQTFAGISELQKGCRAK